MKKVLFVFIMLVVLAGFGWSEDKIKDSEIKQLRELEKVIEEVTFNDTEYYDQIGILATLMSLDSVSTGYVLGIVCYLAADMLKRNIIDFYLKSLVGENDFSFEDAYSVCVKKVTKDVMARRQGNR